MLGGMVLNDIYKVLEVSPVMIGPSTAYIRPVVIPDKIDPKRRNHCVPFSELR